MNAEHSSMDTLYSKFEQEYALTWAHAVFCEYLRKNPNADGAERQKAFSNAVEGGLSLAKEFCQRG